MSRWANPVDRILATAEWQGECLVSPLSKGDRYARLEVAGRKVTAHRLVYEEAHGPLPPEMDVHHTCSIRRCVRLEHLVAEMHSEHKANHVQRDGHYNSAKTHCPSGHPYSPENTSISRGRRSCKACMRAAYHRRKA